MSRWFRCPYLNTDVELTDEREQHIWERHKVVTYDGFAVVATTLGDPDEIRRSTKDPQGRLFIRWQDDVEQGKYCTVVVVDDSQTDGRQWIITAYVTDHPRPGAIEWQRT
jgi:hypothetical protein